MLNFDDGGRRREVEQDLTLRIHHDHYDHDRDDENGDYMKLWWGPQGSHSDLTDPSPSARGASLRFYLKLAVSCICIAFFAFVVFKWIGPLFLEKVIIPIIVWERNTFSTPMLAALVFSTIALFPTLLLPTSPSMWLAGMTFGYGFGFLITVPAAAVGVSLPFFIGSIFHRKIAESLEKYPNQASILRYAGGGNWFHQFKAVALIRISPFPYIIYNYCAVATNVKYWPYLLGSLLGMAPEIFASIYTGVIIQKLANASHKSHALSAPQIAFNAAGFCITVATIIFFTFYAKKRLKEIRKEDEPLLQ